MVRRRIILYILLGLAFSQTSVEGEDSLYKDEIEYVFGNKTTQRECKCVPYYLCEDENIITDGSPVIEPRSIECDSNETYCCKPKPIPPSQVPSIQCGRRNTQFITSLYARRGGDTTSTGPGEFPWTIAVFKTAVSSNGYSRSFEYLCDGALIREGIVLTTAHSVKRWKDNAASRLIARAGEWDIRNDHEVENHQDRFVAEIVLHPRFTPQTLWNDLAILKLEQPFTLGYQVSVICLPPPGTIIISGKCVVSGWGKERYGDRDYTPSVLQKIDVEVVDRRQCNSLYHKPRVEPGATPHDSFICAGGVTGINTCAGDGGSPLACLIEPNGNLYELSGLVLVGSQSGIDCGDAIPRVYAGVGYAREWIENTIRNLV
ncbi:phenoloxidase-activating factor 2 isoform X2 [Halyomorpha halys]|uniref:phenoloxidase-activating factor 2 isoform X2 n=1 Tax=Halyomorpha halys TaxID=286706 RepID=UPI0034D2829B